MNKQELFLPLIALFFFSLFSSVYSGSFSNSGDFRSRNINITTDAVLMNNGSFVAVEKIVLSAGEAVQGSGYIEAPFIEISTKKFAFTGTINCSMKCIIQSEELFDPKVFTAKGGGEFIIINQPFVSLTETVDLEIPKVSVSKQTKLFEQPVVESIKEIEQHTEKKTIDTINSNKNEWARLNQTLVKYIKRNGLLVSEKKLNDIVAEAIHLARNYKVDVQQALEQLIEPIKYELDSCETSIKDLESKGIPKIPLAYCGAALALLASKIYRGKFLERSVEDTGIFVGLVVGMPGFLQYFYDKYTVYNCYEKYSIIKNKIEQALEKERLSN